MHQVGRDSTLVVHVMHPRMVRPVKWGWVSRGFTWVEATGRGRGRRIRSTVESLWYTRVGYRSSSHASGDCRSLRAGVSEALSRSNSESSTCPRVHRGFPFTPGIPPTPPGLSLPFQKSFETCHDPRLRIPSPQSFHSWHCSERDTLPFSVTHVLPQVTGPTILST